MNDKFKRYFVYDEDRRDPVYVRAALFDFVDKARKGEVIPPELLLLVAEGVDVHLANGNRGKPWPLDSGRKKQFTPDIIGLIQAVDELFPRDRERIAIALNVTRQRVGAIINLTPDHKTRCDFADDAGVSIAKALHLHLMKGLDQEGALKYMKNVLSEYEKQ